MKGIFNKDNAGKEEIKRTLSFIDKSVSYDDLKRFIKTAVRELYNVIGIATYEVIADLYIAGTDNADEIELIETVQDVIAIDAYRKYTPSKDVGHTQNGRRMRVDDHEKQAFEWMIDRDNANMERMYYTSLDQLINLLEGLASWKETDEYKSISSLFVSKPSHVQEYFNINNSRLLLLKLQPGLRQCETRAILPRLTKEEFNALKASSEDKEVLLAMVQEACVYWALSWAMKGRLTVALFPEGVMQRFISDRITTQGKKPAALNEAAWAAQEFKNDAEEVLKRIEAHLAPEEVNDNDTGSVLPPIGFGEDDNYVTT